MSTSGKKEAAEGKRSSSGNPEIESVVAGQMNTWLKSLYDYYAERGSQAEVVEGTAAGTSVAQTMHKVILHLDSITEHLRASYPVSTASAPPPSVEKGGSSVSKKEENTGVSQVVKSSESNNGTVSSLPATASSVASANGQRIECRVCLEPISEESGRKFALFEECDHPYCEPCVRSLLHHNGHGAEPLKCPTCRSLSSRALIRSTFLVSGPEKAALFDSVLCCPPHQISRPRSVGEDDETDFELAVVQEEDDVVVPNAIVIEEDDWNAFANYLDDVTTDTTGTEVEDSAPGSTEDSLDFLDVNSSPPSFGSDSHSMDISVQIDGRPFNVALGETVDLLDTWSLDDDYSQADGETETMTTFYEEDFVTYPSSDEETDRSFSF